MHRLGLLLLFLSGCAWGAPRLHSEGIPALVVNLISDQVEDLQTKRNKKGKIPRMKEPLMEWGPFRLRSDGKTRIRRVDRGRKDRKHKHYRIRTSASFKLSSDMAYAEIRFRF